MKRVARISVSPVKGFRLSHPSEVELGVRGVAENRRFFLVGPDGQRLRSSATPWPVLVEADYDSGAERLLLRFPDGESVEGDAAAVAERIHSTSGTIDVTGRVVDGPWEAPLSQLAGHPVRLVRTDRVGAGLNEPVTLVSDGSLARLAEEAGVDEVDARRFRMLFELQSCDPHEEDTWDGRLFAIGDAVVRVGGPVDRCAVTTRDPDTGERDLDTLRLIRRYRGRRERDGAILFGVYATVVRPGRVRLGDAFEPLE
ncbi:MAG TPA: MOSC N-terminal beta barrel domain-containing protein [Gaiellaceae bacterium]|nr:MOSC N-terminal beta barrel domain-containing protein [Gaiellaceae bacterium]